MVHLHPRDTHGIERCLCSAIARGATLEPGLLHHKVAHLEEQLFVVMIVPAAQRGCARLEGCLLGREEHRLGIERVLFVKRTYEFALFGREQQKREVAPAFTLLKVRAGTEVDAHTL